ncbi:MULTISPECIES: competence protein CoiA family protein [Roseomonadaceae]|uniref:Antitoxin Xre/MbcA/ParS-like toxin-binding domain-containing protein n=1 Tax=Falsiroseomonas oleicola TaxID=2801474 RepID=A0ABS6HF76_9PROT|nr:hypothetical protein [Roseomonas oleicola]MBU8546146.1 hypothetical protein [Roseomonas oleicola]
MRMRKRASCTKVVRMRRVACKTAEDEDDVLLPLALGPGGKLVHARDMPSGLACGCTCPGCGSRLEAHHPGPERPGRRRQRHHFQHSGVRACAVGLESAVHLKAKEVLLASDQLRLPDGHARVPGMEPELVVRERPFRYERPDEEVRDVYAGFVPDGVVRRGEHELLVEFRWRHETGLEKIERIRAHGTSCIEVDLRKMPLHGTEEEQRNFVLFGAARHWLHNRLIAAAEERMRERRDAAEAKKLEWDRRLFGELAAEVKAALASAPQAGGADWVAWAREVGVGGYLGDPVEGDACMSVDRAVWQTAIFLVLWRGSAGRMPTAQEILERLISFGMLKKPFDQDLAWHDEIVAAVCREAPEFRPPTEVVAAFADAMVGRRVLAGRGRSTTRRWQLGGMIAMAITRHEEAAEAARERERELEQDVRSLVEALGEPLSAALDGWTDVPLPDLGRSPLEVARSGKDAWSGLRQDLRRLAAMARPGGKAVPEDGMLGLPLEELRATRIREAADREAEWRRREEESERRLAEKRRAESLAFIDRALTDACLLLGREEGAAWVAAAVARRVDEPFDEARQRLGFIEIRAIQADLDALHDSVAREREAERRRAVAEGIAAQAVNDRRERLLRKALQANRSNVEMAELWMRGHHPALGCSPWDACKTDAGFSRAEDIFGRLIRSGGGKRR